jgi:hypothetical protein
MSVPEPLAYFIETTRSAIREANLTNAAHLERKAAKALEDMRYYIKPTPGIDRSAGAAVAAAAQLQRAWSERGLLAKPDDPAIVQARVLALLAIDKLAERLADEARPSPEAVMIGTGW